MNEPEIQHTSGVTIKIGLDLHKYDLKTQK